MNRARESRLISGCSSWDEFFAAACSLPNTAQQGAAFERLVQLYLKTQPEYQTHLRSVWTLAEVPMEVRTQLRLTQVDEGIDLIAKTRDGDYWAIQCKFRRNKDHRLTRRELSTFTSLTFHSCQGISLAVIAHTCAKPVKKHGLLPNTVELGLERWLALAGDDWQRIRSLTIGKSIRPRPRKPRAHQRRAIAAAKKHYVEDGASRGRLIMPCGTGKSLTAFWIARALAARTILVAVPSLALVRQSLTDWTREFLAAGQVPEWLVVCSDESTGNLDRDEFVGTTYDLGIPTTTDAAEIADFLKRDTSRLKIAFTTYQSGNRLAQGAKRADFTFDLGIFDEAHKTVGAKSKAFAALLFDSNVPVRRRVFMTATERVLSSRNDDVLSMDDPSTYGDRFHLLSFKQAIGDKLISDYRLVTITVSDERIQRLIEDRRLLNIGKTGLDDADAQSLAAGIALKRTYEKYKVRHAISFHRSIRSADQFADQQASLNEIDGLGPLVTSLHISSKKSAGERADLMRSFANAERALLTNARCLTEGVDIPAIDCVLFADPKQSSIDIVQAAGRALRNFEGKEFGYIVLPLVVPSGMTFDEFAETTEFRQVAKTITALSIQDERIAEEFRAVDRAKKPTGRVVSIEGDVPVGMRIDAGQFAVKISTKVWQRVGRANWRSFTEAREYVRSQRLRSLRDWREFVSSDRLPSDIPSNPNRTYLGDGWLGMGDWLGTGNVAPFLMQFRPFTEARSYARSLGLKSRTEWNTFWKSGKCPSDVPAAPWKTYRGAGWRGMGDWLGTGTVAPRLRIYRPFEKARTFVQSLRLKSRAAWTSYCAGGNCPGDIPSKPGRVYQTDGWLGWGDWLGTGTVAPRLRRYRRFDEARAFVQSLRLNSGAQWRDYWASGQCPSDIPAAPHYVYADSGWKSMGDWLGTGSVAPRLREFRRFEEARDYVRSMGFKSDEQWREFASSGKRPHDIPSNPNITYAADGWTSMDDWLGPGTILPRTRQFRSFDKARDFSRSLRLKSRASWREFAASGSRPLDIPYNPQKLYASDGWVSWDDWLGVARVK